MAQTISRLFADPGMAHGAAAALRKHRVFAGGVDVQLPQAAPDVADAEHPDRVLTGHGQLRSNRLQESTPAGRQAADCIRVTVEAAWGSANLATQILERFDPLRVGEDQVPATPSRDKAAPLSSVLGIPLLIDNPTPLSSLLRIRVLVDDKAPLSSLLGLPVLIRTKSPSTLPRRQTVNRAPG